MRQIPASCLLYILLVPRVSRNRQALNKRLLTRIHYTVAIVLQSNIAEW